MTFPENFPPRGGIELPGDIIVLPRTAAYGSRGRSIYDRPLDMGLVGFSVMLKKDGFAHQAIRELRLGRLSRIHQLQSLTWVRVGNQSKLPDGEHIFPHTRLLPHAILSATLRALSCRFTLECDGPEALVAVLEDLMHDVGTCAGGDAWRTLNLPNGRLREEHRTLFNEDLQLLTHFRSHWAGWKRLRARYNLPENTNERVAKAVRDEVGLEGACHTLADSLSYLSSDVDLLLTFSQRAGIESDFLREVHELSAPPVFDLWKYVKVTDGTLVFTRPDILERFLRLRLQMWTGVYDHPGNKVIELLLSNVVYPHLWQQKGWRPGNLLRWHDGNLEELIENTIAVRGFGRRIDASGTIPMRELYHDCDSALGAEARYAKNGLTLFVDMNKLHVPSTKTGKFMVNGNGPPQPFSQAYPKVAAELSEQARAPADGARWHLVHYPAPPPTEGLKRAWEEARERWRSALNRTVQSSAA